MTQQYTPAQLEAWASLRRFSWPKNEGIKSAAPDLARLVLDKDAEIARLQKALAFYADPLSWKARGNPQMDYDTKPILRDGGAIARQAMKETSDE